MGDGCYGVFSYVMLDIFALLCDEMTFDYLIDPVKKFNNYKWLHKPR